jgi:hypothetical protein
MPLLRTRGAFWLLCLKKWLASPFAPAFHTWRFPPIESTCRPSQLSSTIKRDSGRTVR